MNTPLIKLSRVSGLTGRSFQAHVRHLALSLLLLSAVLLTQPCMATPGEWSITGALNTPRNNQTATLLLNGKVLVAGGIIGQGTASAELYDPATGLWTPTGSLNQGRYYHTATLLLDGRVLVAGGYVAGGEKVLTTELYDPATGVWTRTGKIHEQRYQHAASLLPDGRVLIVGGYHPEVYLKSTEIYDPATGVWTPGGALNIARSYTTATLLNNGNVLVAGGASSAAAPAELYDPVAGTWRLTGALHQTRVFFTTTLLPNGMVLVAAGTADIPASIKLRSAEIYDPSTELWTETGDLNFSRYRHTATLLSNGLVLVAAGSGEDGAALASAELYDPASGSWSNTGSLNFVRSYHAATLLNNGMVLVEGIVSSPSAELYDPGVTVTATTVTGRGSISGQGDTATFNFRANLTGDRPSGSVTFRDAAAGVSMSKAKVRTLTFDGNSATLGGNGRLSDGTKVTYSVTATDSSSDGSTDSFTISLSNGYSAGGTLTSGDITIQ